MFTIVLFGYIKDILHARANWVWGILKRSLIIAISVSVILIGGLLQGTVFSQSVVPQWVKNTAKWYGEGIVSENEYLNSLKFLIDNNIIKISKETKPEAEKEKTETLEASQDPTSFQLVSKPRLRNCILLNDSYQKLGEERFVQRYSSINYIRDCVKLYKDPVWVYQGTDRIDKLFEKFSTFRAESKSTSVANPSEMPVVRTLSTINVGTEKYLVKFNVCAGSKALDKAQILVQSQIEAVQVGSNKDIPANSCRTYETQIHAKSSTNIQTMIIEQVFLE